MTPPISPNVADLFAVMPLLIVSVPPLPFEPVPFMSYTAALLPSKVNEPTVTAPLTLTILEPLLPPGLPKVVLSGRVESKVRPGVVPSVHFALPVLLHVPVASTSCVELPLDQSRFRGVSCADVHFSTRS